MRLKKVTLFTDKLESERAFQVNVMNFELLNSCASSFTIKVGWSEIKYVKSIRKHKYHYCYLIPSNQLENALKWLKKRTNVILIDDGKEIQNFKSWNADSIYYYDASGNLAEFIVRYDLDNNRLGKFDVDMVICLNEIGMPTNDIDKINNFFQTKLGSEFWKGDMTRFGTNGNQNGIILMPNFKTKKTWFPTNLKLTPEPFEAIIEIEEINYVMRYDGEDIELL